MKRSGMWSQRYGRAVVIGGVVAAAATGGLLAADGLKPVRTGEKGLAEETVAWREPIPARTDGVPQLRAQITPVDPPGGGVAGGGCPGTTVTHSSYDFMSGPLIIQAGFIENEIAAASYTLSAAEFPLTIRTTEMIFAQCDNQGCPPAIPSTTHWSILVWDGTPTNGTLVAEFSSDDVILPHLTLPISNSWAANVLVTVDPGDPEQITVFNNSGTNTFTVGYRIDQHNAQNGNPCDNFFDPFPAPNENAFPTTDAGPLNFATQNWVFADSGPFCFCGGWHTFSQLPSCGVGTPSGDWNLRVTYEPFDCPPGACCLPDGTCQVELAVDCGTIGGTFLGSDTQCNGSCPDPVGACCSTGMFGGCSDGETEVDCVSAGDIWQGAGTTCGGGCITTGACCLPGGCLDLVEDDCATAGGTTQGLGTLCATTVCNPIGACCIIATGGCIDTLSPEDCSTAGGNFQGHQSLCSGVSCPPPTGACCLSNGNCLVFTEANCGIAAGAWAGPLTNCADGNSNGTADACETSSCPSDTNGDGQVNVTDLVQVVLDWGMGPGSAGDVNDDGTVNVTDLVQVVLAWGPCAP